MNTASQKKFIVRKKTNPVSMDTKNASTPEPEIDSSLLNASCPQCGKKYFVEQHGYYQCDDCKTYFYYPPDLRLCQYCQSEIPASAAKCAHCGEWIDKTKGKSRSTYLLLTFLFGNLGVGEFYANDYLSGSILLILSFLALAKPEALVLVYILSVCIALRSDFCLSEKQAKKKNLIWKYIIIIVSVFGIAIGGYFAIKYYPV